MTFKVGNTEINTVSMIEPYGDDLNIDMKSIHEEHLKPWVRPSEWLDMPEVTDGAAALIYVPSGNDDFIISLFARNGDVSNNCPTYINVDWGDGYSGVFSGTRSDGGVTYPGYFGYLHKRYTFDSLPESTQFEHNGWPVRQVIIELDGSISGISHVNFRPLSGRWVGSHSNYDTDPYYTDYDGSIVNITRTGNTYNNQNNRQSSTLLDLLVRSSGINVAYISSSSEVSHKYCERVVLDTSGVYTPYLFFDMQRLQSVEMASGSTATQRDFRSMFQGCSRLTEVPFFDTSSATGVESIFNGCINLKQIPQYDTSSVTDFTAMFHRNQSLVEIPSLDFSNGVRFESMFSYNFNLQTIPSGLDFSSAREFDYMFQYCTKLQAVPKFDFSNIVDMRSMFRDCRSLKGSFELDAPNLGSQGLTEAFYNCHNVTKMHVKNIGNANQLNSSFQGMINCRNFKWSDSGCQPINMWMAFAYSYYMTEAPDIDFSQVTGARGCFEYCWNLKNVPVYDFSSMTYSERMFYHCLSLTEVNVKNVINKPNTNNMFSQCQNLRKAPSGFFQDYNSTPNYYPGMFSDCYYLEDVSDYTISGVGNTSTNNRSFLYNCGRLKKLPKTINTDGGTYSMFERCYSIQHAGPYDLSNAVNNAGMFNYCNSLRTVDISGINASIGFHDCFLGSGELTKIINNLGTTSATLDIRNNYGTYELHPDTIAIATNKGWSVLT